MEQLGYAAFHGQQHWGDLRTAFFLSYLHTSSLGAGEPPAAGLGGDGIRLDEEEEEVARKSLDGERRRSYKVPCLVFLRTPPYLPPP